MSLNTNSNDYKFQELCRVVDATTGTYNSSGLITGHNCLNFIALEYQKDGLKDFISAGLYELIGVELQKAEGKRNVREHVKKILMYPLTGYLDWKVHSVPGSILEDLDFAISRGLQFECKLVEGKVYAVPLTDKDLIGTIFNFVCENIIPLRDLKFRENFETAHVTLVNSNIVADMNPEKVAKFLKEHNKPFSIHTGRIKSTTSLDWSRFSDCYVVEIQSEGIDDFLREFNSEFGLNIKPCPHITFAIKSRSLFEYF